MTYRNTEPAGGASKNRLYDDIVILDKGEYEVNYVTDGSHSFNDWNSAKPRDPSGWGITISIDKGQTSSYTKAKKSYSGLKVEKPIYINIKKADKHFFVVKLD